MLGLPLPVDVQWILWRTLLLHQFVVGKLSLSSHRQCVLLLPLVDVLRQDLLVLALAVVVGVESIDPEVFWLSFCWHLMRFWFVVDRVREVASEVVSQFLLVDLNRCWSCLLFVRNVVVG